GRSRFGFGNRRDRAPGGERGGEYQRRGHHRHSPVKGGIIVLGGASAGSNGFRTGVSMLSQLGSPGDGQDVPMQAQVRRNGTTSIIVCWSTKRTSVIVRLPTMVGANWVTPCWSCTVIEILGVVPSEVKPIDSGNASSLMTWVVARMLSCAVRAHDPGLTETRMPSVSVGTRRSLCNTTTTSVTGSWQPAAAASSISAGTRRATSRTQVRLPPRRDYRSPFAREGDPGRRCVGRVVA